MERMVRIFRIYILAALPFLHATESQSQIEPIPDTVLVFVMDLSGSTRSGIAGDNCGMQQSGAYETAPENAVLQCMIKTMINLNAQAANNSTVGEVALVVYGLTAHPAQFNQPTGGLNVFTAPLNPGPNSEPEFNYVVRTASPGRIEQRTPLYFTGWTNYEEAIKTAIDVAFQSSYKRKEVVMLSDGESNRGLHVDTQLNRAIGRVTFNTIAIGHRIGCNWPDERGNLQYIANQTGGVCTDVDNVSELPTLPLPNFSQYSATFEQLEGLGSLGGFARDMNESGMVAGASWDNSGTLRAVVWPGKEMPPVDLGMLASSHQESVAWGINSSGQVVGTSSTHNASRDGTAIFLVTPLDSDVDGVPDTWYTDADGDGLNDLMSTIPDLGGGRAVPEAISDTGIIVGFSTINGQAWKRHAMLWSIQTGLVDLGTLGGSTSIAQGINSAGAVFGHATDHSEIKRYVTITPQDADSDTVPDTWFADEDGDGVNDLMQVLSLQTPDGFDVIDPKAGINSNGYLAGIAVSNSTEGGSPIFASALWDSSGRVSMPDTLDGESSIAMDINDSQMVVGASDTIGGQRRPYRWRPNEGALDIGALSQSTGTAYDINGYGDVMAGVTNTDSGVLHAARWHLSNTEAGSAVVIDPEAGGIRLQFNHVSSPGYTSVTPTGTNPGPDIIGKIVVNGTYYDIHTTADFVDTVEICFPVEDSETLGALSVLHLSEDRWVEEPLVWNASLGEACTTINHFSYFALAHSTDIPLANAGIDQVVRCNAPDTTTFLDGAKSSDPNGDQLRYSWTGSDWIAEGARPSVSLPSGRHIIELNVTDGNGNSSSDTVAITVLDEVKGTSKALADLANLDSELNTSKGPFKAGRTIPLRLTIGCGGQPSSTSLKNPKLIGFERIDDGSGNENLTLYAHPQFEEGVFRSSGTEWVYTLRTKGYTPGRYQLLIQTGDGRLWQSSIELR